MFISEDLDPEALKNEANIKWKEGNMEEANIIWRQALKECIKYSMRGIPTNKNRDMQISLRLNLSLYHYKKKEYSDCINQCNIIIDNLLNLDEMLQYYDMGDEEENKKENNNNDDDKGDHMDDDKNEPKDDDKGDHMDDDKGDHMDDDKSDHMDDDKSDHMDDDKNEPKDDDKGDHMSDDKNEPKDDDKGDHNYDDKDKSNVNLQEKKYIIKKDILIKIFLRRASSFLCLQEFNKCNEDLGIIKKLENNDAEAAILEKKMIIEKKYYERKQKELYKKMCNSK
ncbi:conserved Plasmodium protein, unknown function [Plasmodium reichenowi]|uniref:Tetratricopeptide repeat protein n=1 Tax=Plasmodium reichenowi TaxID=5854 RepID=A0A060RVU2_PLARE|nr:conserved Plasmodium protein, unknown function [Plasmodium reichenowi]